MGAWVGLPQEKRKIFFFEKKKQKTFALLSPNQLQGRDRRPNEWL
jgi:hypothetical protein